MKNKRILSLLVTLALCLSLLPTTAMARAMDDVAVTITETPTIVSGSGTSTVTLKGTYDDTTLGGTHTSESCILTFVLEGESIVNGESISADISSSSINTKIYLHDWNNPPDNLENAKIAIFKQGDALRDISASMRVGYGSEHLTFKAEWSAHADHDNLAFQMWNESNRLPTTAGNYYLRRDVTLGGTWNVPTDGTVNLCLNGHVIKADYEEGSVIRVPIGATLNLYDCNSEAEHYFDNTTWGLIDDLTDESDPSAEIIYGGCITGGTGDSVGGTPCGGGVCITGGTFNMCGGSIVGNIAADDEYKDGCGGGVYVGSGDEEEDTSAFTISGTAQIIGNEAVGGGGVYACRNQSFNMLGGKISSNTATNIGGGVCVQANGSFAMTGGTISGNTATDGEGGGIYVAAATEPNAAVVYLGGSAVIKDNLANAAACNLYLPYYLAQKSITLGTGTNGFAAPADGMFVGVTTGTEPTEGDPVTFTSNGAENAMKYFFSDNEDYAVNTAADSSLQLVKLADADKYEVWVGGIRVNTYNKGFVLGNGTVFFAPETESAPATLILNGAKIYTDSSAGNGNRPRDIIGIKSSLTNLTVKLEGAGNQIGNTKAYKGIQGEGVTFTGSGSLTIYDLGCGIEADNVTFNEGFTGSLKIENSGDYSAIYTSHGGITIKGGTFVLTSNSSYGIHSNGNVTINGAGITATASNRVINAPETGSDISVNNSRLNLTCTDESECLFADNAVIVTGSAITATTPKYGIYGYNGGISIADSTITVEAGEVALCAEYGDIKISGSNTIVKAKGNEYAIGGPSEEDFFKVSDNLTCLGSTDFVAFNLATRPTSIGSINYSETTDYFVFVADSTIAKTVVIQPNQAPSPSGGGSGTYTITVPVTGEESKVNVSATVSGSTATVNIKDADIEKAAGVIENGLVEIDLTGLNKEINTAKIPTETVDKIAEQGDMSVKLSTATVTFDSTAAEAISEQAKGNTIELRVDDNANNTLTSAQKASIQDLGSQLVVEAYLVSGGVRISDFKGGSAEVSIPYTLKSGQNADGLVVYFVADDGTVEKIPAKYESGKVLFTVSHFSHYVVAYGAPKSAQINPFVDVASGSYYYDAVMWAFENNITSGTNATHFSPDMGTSRAQVVTFLWRLAGCPEPASMISFSDIPRDAYYAKAVAWAMERGVTVGTSATTFSPDRICTRGQIVTFIYRYNAADTLNIKQNPFSDISEKDYYYNAVLWAAERGITEGTSATVFSPNNDCTRAQIVTFLYRYIGE